MNISKLILVRHGESIWNKLNQFTGWTDVELSKQGQKEAIIAGKILKKHNLQFDYCYTSVLKRAIHTLWLILNELNQFWLPVKKTWRFNERHYGKLQGLNKESIIEKYGFKQIEEWRRSFHAIPPKIEKEVNLTTCYDRRYYHLQDDQIPYAESLELTLRRLIPFWEKHILPKVHQSKTILIVAHGNSLRALIKHLSQLNNKEVFDLQIPTGVPIIYDIHHGKLSIQYSLLQNLKNK